MNSVLASRYAKVALFLWCLVPLAKLGYAFHAGTTGANPVEFIEHSTGDWAIRGLLVTLCITPLRKLTGLSQLARFRRLLGLFTFFYAVLHFLAYLWFDQQFDPMGIIGDISKRRYITVGFLGWIGMAALATTSTAGWVRRMGLKRWQRLHNLVYMSGTAAVIHYYWLVKSDIRLPAMYGAILGVLLIARVPWFWKRQQNGSFRLRLAKIYRETNDAVTLTFSLPDGKRLPFRAGQFVTFSWIVGGQALPRSYSISSAPSRPGSFDITVKKQGIVSTFLNESAREGLTVTASGPYGRFALDLTTHRSPVLFAAGSGITPILSMLRHIEETAPERGVILFYASRDEHQIIFKAELDRLATRLNNLRWIPVISKPTPEWAGEQGAITTEMVLRTLPSIEGRTFFLCGPPGFMMAAKTIFASLGVAVEQILQERFAPGAATFTQAESVPCTVEFTKSRKRLECTSSETLLAVAERNDIRIPQAVALGNVGRAQPVYWPAP